MDDNKKIQAIIEIQVQNMSIYDFSGVISSSSQMMSPMNNVIVQEIRPTKMNGKIFKNQLCQN